MVVYSVTRQYDNSLYGKLCNTLHIHDDFDGAEEALSQIKSSVRRYTVISCEPELLKQRERICFVLDSLSLMKQNVFLPIDANHFYNYLNPNRLFLSIRPLKFEHEYRKKNYRTYILHRYLLECHFLELNFTLKTYKDIDRVYNIFENMPPKVYDRLQLKQIPIVLNGVTAYARELAEMALMTPLNTILL